MRIALNVKSFDPLHGGGERYTVNLARSLLEHDHEVHVVTLRGSGEAPGAHVHEVAVPGFPKLLRDQRFADRSRRVLDELGCDLVFGTGKSPWVDIYRPGGGMHRAYIEHDARSARTAMGRAARRFTRTVSLKERINLRLERRTMASPRLKRVIVNSDMVKEHVAQCYPDFPSDKVLVHYNGVDVRKFSLDSRRKHRFNTRCDFGFTKDHVVVLLVGNNFRLKGVWELLQALAQLREDGVDNVRALVVGKGRVRRAKRWAKRLGVADSVIFAGGRRDMPAMYAAADVLAHPTYYDPCANVTLEAWASGLPVITTRFNGASGLMADGEEGFVLDRPNDISRFAECLRAFTSQPFRQVAGVKARVLAEANSMDHYYHRIVDVFEQVANNEQRMTNDD